MVKFFGATLAMKTCDMEELGGHMSFGGKNTARHSSKTQNEFKKRQNGRMLSVQVYIENI
jgi:hypothetical protein